MKAIFLRLVPEGPEAEMEDSDEMSLLAADFEIGHMLRDSIIPKAVLYYTGEVGDEDEGDVSERCFVRISNADCVGILV